MSKHHGLTIGILAAALAFAGSAAADPAKIAGGSPADGAFREFGKFADTWMSQMKAREATNRRQPTIAQRGGRGYATYTGYAPEWNVEVHATGDKTAPYVGVLHYQEQVFTCTDETTRKCSVSSSTPVSEVFPYRNGAWKY